MSDLKTEHAPIEDRHRDAARTAVLLDLEHLSPNMSYMLQKEFAQLLADAEADGYARGQLTGLEMAAEIAASINWPTRGAIRAAMKALQDAGEEPR